MIPMDEKAEARKKVATVLADYERVRASGSLDDSSEATARTWIERVLDSMGWDPGNPREVVQEKRIASRDAVRAQRDETVHERPDYGFLLKHLPVAYLEAKAFRADFDADSNEADSIAFQVRTYGYAKGLRVSYAFNIEQFAVWDTRHFANDSDTASRHRILFLRRAEFLDHFDDLWDFLGRDAILAGSIQRRVPDARRTPDAKPFDVAFEERLTEWRLEIAKAILRYGKEHTPDIMRRPEVLSAATQRIVDRLVFIRFCESMGLEEYGSLRSMTSPGKDFWAEFKKGHDRWRAVYDGILFPARDDDDPTGAEAYINQWWLKGSFWKGIGDDLYRRGYRFSDVPLELLGGIYERFLGKELKIVGAGVKDEYKPEYQQTKGAVYTPTWVVQRVLDRTLGPLADARDPEELLALRIIDPACGSGSFLLGTFDWLERRIKDWFREHPRDARRPDWVRPTANDVRLAPRIVRRLIEQCLYGVDIDTQAVEVARMSLALRLLERSALEVGEEPKDLLKGIGRNVKQGNSLVGVDSHGLGFDVDAIRRVRAFDWESGKHGFGDVMHAGGFHAVVGNPPYIEVKRYKKWLPDQYRYFKSKPPPYETAGEGKTDVSIPFMEKGARLLRAGGRLGFIIQNRFFKTEYGELARHWLLRDGLLEDVEDFRDTQIFDGRTTYTAIVTLSRQQNDEFAYRTYLDLAAAQAADPLLETRYKRASVGRGVWAFDQPDLLGLHDALAKRHGVIGLHRQMSIGVGLQTLWGKAYTLRASHVGPRTVRAAGLGGDERSFERGALRPLCMNKGFYPFRRNNADAWVIFPYDVKDGEFTEVRWTDFKTRYPNTAKYLDEHRKEIRDAVAVNPERERWHLYKYPKNLVAQTRPKVLFPMTIEDTMASADLEGSVYQDNVNINGLQFLGNGIDLQSVAAIFNSSLFNALAKLKAGLNEGGWRKFNSQFATLVPFPLKNLDASWLGKLRTMAEDIQEAQESYVVAAGEAERGGIRSLLERHWRTLDEASEEIYALTPQERAVARRYPRGVDRIDLLTRQAVVPEDEDQDAS